MSAKKRLRLAQIVFLPSEEEFDEVKLETLPWDLTFC